MRARPGDGERPATSCSPPAGTWRLSPGLCQSSSGHSPGSRFGQAVAAAPQLQGRGRDLSLALANRSAALLRLGFPQLALEDVAEALEAGYPGELAYKVVFCFCYQMLSLKVRERAVRCLLLLKRPQPEVLEAVNSFEKSLASAKLEDSKKDKLRLEVSELGDGKWSGSYDVTTAPSLPAEEIPKIQNQNAMFPAFSSSVSITYSPDRGRFGVATRDIPAGGLVLVERPFVSCLHLERWAGTWKCLVNIKRQNKNRYKYNAKDVTLNWC